MKKEKIKNKIDLSDIKENDLDKTATFTDLLSRSERKKRKSEKDINSVTKEKESSIDDIESMLAEKRKSTNDLDIKNNNIIDKNNEEETENKNNEELLGKTQILELTRQMKFNLEENTQENLNKKKHGVSVLNIIGELNLLCIGYYIYTLIFTKYQELEKNYLISGGLIVLLVLMFGISIITKKKISKLFNLLNILLILTFIIFNVYVIIK